MKKYILLLLALLPVLVFADNVSVDRAKILAEQFFRNNYTLTKSSDINLDMVWDGSELQTKGTNQSVDPVFYVFNNTIGKGYVIVAADDAVMPVLGYSLTSNVPSQHEMPVNFRSWMNFIRREMDYARSNGLHSSESVKQSWRVLAQDSNPVGKVVKYHQTASWDQSAPFWNECPQYKKKQTYTGCVITAVSTVMKFHKWPDHGNGTTEAYSTETKKIKVKSRTLGKKYDWDNMPLRYFDEDGKKLYNSQQGSEVSRLMADVGAILKADYGTEDMGGTGAYSDDIPEALATYMGYDKSIYCASRDYYSADQWIVMLKEELNDCPVVYGGVSRDGGHSFVIDGYTENDYFHVNWGWGGMSDGYFLLSALDPDEQGAGGSTSGFNTMQDAIFNMRPDHGGEAVNQMLMVPIEDSDNDIYYYGIVPSVNEIKKGVSFKMTVGALINAGFAAFDCDVQVCVVSADGNIKEVLYKDRFDGQDKFETGYVYGLDDIEVRVTNDILPGDRIKIFYKSDNMNSFVPVLGASADNFTYELLLSEGAIIETEPDFTHEIALTYLRSERRMLVGIPEGVSFVLEGADGKNHSDVCSVGKFMVTVDMLRLDKGDYRMVFTKGKQKKVVTIKY